MENPSRKPFPNFWIYFGYAILPVFGLFVARILWEETLLTWNNGPQMVGFSMMHGGAMPAFFAGLLGLPLCLLWMLFAAGFLIAKRFPASPFEWTPLVLLPLLFALLCVPYSIWEEVGVRLNGPGNYGHLYMAEAAARGNTRFVAYLFEHGQEINPRDTSGGTPLSAASVGGQEATIRFLLSKGADVNGKEGILGETPIMGAAQRNQMAAVKLLLENGASPCETDRDGTTAEGQARRFHQNEVAQYLSQFNCKEDIKPCVDSAFSTCVH